MKSFYLKNIFANSFLFGHSTQRAMAEAPRYWEVQGSEKEPAILSFPGDIK